MTARAERGLRVGSGIARSSVAEGTSTSGAGAASPAAPARLEKGGGANHAAEARPSGQQVLLAVSTDLPATG
jgi:hypothetical protein